VVDVVDVEVVVEVDDVVVDVDAAVVTGVVVEVVPDSVEVVAPLPSATDDEVAPESVAAGSSSLQPAIAMARRTRGSSRVDFTDEVCHAMWRLPDQRVCLVATFNKL
jgi:hypothetical protein